jgi:hypothetical protein
VFIVRNYHEHVLNYNIIHIRRILPNLICLMGPYFPNISYISSAVILNGKLRTNRALKIKLFELDQKRMNLFIDY